MSNEIKMSMIEKIEMGHYNNNMKRKLKKDFISVCDCGCPNCGTMIFDKNAHDNYLKKYRHHNNVLIENFKNDLLEEFGLSKHSKKDAFFDKAWSDGHSYGFHEVYIKMADLIDLA